MTGHQASPFVGCTVTGTEIVLDDSRIERWRRAINGLVPPPLAPDGLAAVNVQPFLALSPDQLPPGAVGAVTAEVSWQFRRPVEPREKLELLSYVNDHYRLGLKDRVDIVTVAKTAAGENAMVARVTLSWKANGDDGVALLVRRPAPSEFPDPATPLELGWRGPITRQSVSSLFEGLPNAQLNPHVSLDAAQRRGFKDLLVSAPQLSCIIAKAVSANVELVGASLRLHFLRPVLAGEKIAVVSQTIEDGLHVGLWSNQPEGPVLCVKGQLTREDLTL